MAVINPTQSFLNGDPNMILVTWVLDSTNTTGAGWKFTDYADVTWHAGAGANWGGATAAVQGSNRDTDAEYGALKGAAGGTAITWTADGNSPSVALERPVFERPKLTTAGVAASVTVTAMARRHPRKTA